MWEEKHFPTQPATHMVQNEVSMSSPEPRWGRKGPAAVLEEAAATLQAAWPAAGTSGVDRQW